MEQGRTCDIFRLTMVYSSMAGHGGIWLVLRVYRYTARHGDRAARYTVGAGQHSRKEARDTNATRSILVYDIRHANTVHNRHHQSFATPGCVYRVRACVILLYYYNIIILLYYYIYIYPIYPVYPVYLIYPIYPTMVI